MKSLLLLVTTIVLGAGSAFAASVEFVHCDVTTTTSNENSYDKILVSDNLSKDESFYIKPNGEVIKQRTQDITDIASFDKSTVISARVQGDEIYFSIGTWDASQVGQGSMIPDQIDLFSKKSNGISLMARSKKLWVICRAI